ncbi:MAG: NAD-dependent epimerase/dehydratase family protein [Nitrospirae bacterium]|nr:NAD-dependent epimerase/dehydratase family protein [Nitrospirota bacterium]
MNDKTKILILGFGALGRALAHRHGAHYEFRGIKRTPLASAPCPVLLMPIMDAGIVDSLAWADHVVFCPAASTSDLEAYRATYLDNMVSIIARMAERRITPRSVILISSTGVYPESMEEFIDETHEPVVKTERQEILLQTERALIDSGLPYVVLRCGGLYGEGRGDFLARLADGRITSAMLSGQFVHFIHVNDVCDAIDLAISRNVTGEIFNLVDDSQIRRAEFYRFLSSLYGLPIPDGGSPPEIVRDRLISNAKAKSQLGLTLSSPRITDYLQRTAASPS